MKKTKFAIGCLVQWYECDIIEEYVNSLKDALSIYDGDVLVDFLICANQDLEKCINDKTFAKAGMSGAKVISINAPNN